MAQKSKIWAAGLAVVLVLLIMVSAGQGYMEIPLDRVGAILWGKITGVADGADELFTTVVVDIRLPRILTAALVGAGLSVSGAVYQGILLNPLADPYTLGVSAGAAFGAALAILFLPALPHVLPLAAFTGAIVTLAGVIYLSSGRTFGREGLSSNSLILSGIIVASILSAGISFLKYLADEEVSIIIFWLMGSFASKTWADVILVFCVILAGTLVMLFFARDLNLISLGNRAAATLGVDTRKVTLWLLLTASVTAAVCVSVSGIIGFVGLLVPHMVRSVTGPDNRSLIPVSSMAGAVLMLGADTLTRAVLPVEIPIGILTALLGGPVFCYLFSKSHARGNR